MHDFCLYPRNGGVVLALQEERGRVVSVDVIDGGGVKPISSIDCEGWSNPFAIANNLGLHVRLQGNLLFVREPGYEIEYASVGYGCLDATRIIMMAAGSFEFRIVSVNASMAAKVPPADRPMAPIRFGSILYFELFARTKRTAALLSAIVSK